MSGVTQDGVLKTDDINGGGSSTSVAIGQPINATDASVLNTGLVGTEYGVVVRPVTTNTVNSSVFSVPADVVSIPLIENNPFRVGAFFFNDSTATLYLKLGAAVSLTDYTVQIPPGGFYEVPHSPFYMGDIYGIWSAAVGSVKITVLNY